MNIREKSEILKTNQTKIKLMWKTNCKSTNQLCHKNVKLLCLINGNLAGTAQCQLTVSCHLAAVGVVRLCELTSQMTLMSCPGSLA